MTEVEKSTLPPPVLQGQQTIPQHLITLTSIEDDALGESLQVIWEVEPGAHIIEQEALPDPTNFDLPRRLDAFLNAVRWGAISSADTSALQAPFRSGIDLEDYQLDPLVRAVQMSRVNLLIADDAEYEEAEIGAAEIEAEQEAIQSRFADPQPRLYEW